ncbi:hypothetical protein [Streptomyces sp. RTd22]|uniref:hypothetical protein n=1 Tax=Streptomyces sp. RTd22 TaxID=1841249 RepID=UPI0007C55802|nr:hypothetical protein [Streptomyces sp. RTd22]
MGLSKQDVRAIRNADGLVFFHNAPISRGGERMNWLKCIRDGSKTSSGFEDFHVVRLESTSITYYGEDAHTKHSASLGDEKVVGSVYISSPGMLPQHETWMRALREGDELRVQMWLGNNNGYLKESGMAHDYAWLDIRRPKTDARTRYWLGNVICPATSTCRMLRAL